VRLRASLARVVSFQEQMDLQQALQSLAGNLLEVAVLLLSFTWAIFVLLVLLIRVLMVVRDLPVPVDPLDMAKPRAFRTWMLGFAALLGPLVAQYFWPLEAPAEGWLLAAAYLLQVGIVAILWVGLELIYGARDRRSKGRA
jgi:hypothetical protein